MVMKMGLKIVREITKIEEAKEGYIYHSDGLVEVNLNYSKPDRLKSLGYKLIKEWIGFEVFDGNTVWDSGRQLYQELPLP